MKDRQVEQAQAQLRIPFVSAALHFISMPAIVYLRSEFGYTFLRPKSVFIAFSWAFILFVIYAWLEPGAWQKNAALCLFGLGAIILYWIHFTVAFVSEIRDIAKHDNVSGAPHILRILANAGIQPPQQFRLLWVIWAEPALVLLAAIAVRWPLGAKNLSTWFLLIAPCLWLKEALNFWFQIRKRKRNRDAMEDAEDGIDGGHAQTEVAPPAPSRKDKVRRKRSP